MGLIIEPSTPNLFVNEVPSKIRLVLMHGCQACQGEEHIKQKGKILKTNLVGNLCQFSSTLGLDPVSTVQLEATL